MEIVIRKLHETEEAPNHLLLEADPSKKKIAEYLKSGIVFVAEYQHELVGVIVVVPRGEEDEIVNLAVEAKYRGRGIAKKLLHFVTKQSEESGKHHVVIGTGNSSINQLALYQKCGFRIENIIKNYFIENYEEAIFENGIQCMDMIVLKKRIKF